jgi:tetratricopeptide (TPR) repeat protein
MTTPAPPELRDMDDLLRDAVAAHRAGDLAAAEQGYGAVLAVAPGQFQALNLLGVLCGQTGRIAEARAHLRRAVALHPSSAEAQKNLAVACELAGDLAAAAAHYAHAAALDPSLAAAQFGLGVCHEAEGQAEAAIACYRRAIDLAPDHAAARNNLAGLLAATAPEEAEALLREAVARAPAYPEAHSNLGALLLRRGDAAAAAEVLAHAVALRPGYADAMANLGAAWRAAGREAEGLAQLRAAVAADPTAILPRWMLAAALAEGGDGAAAETVLREALVLAPDNPDTRIRLGQLLYHRGRFAEAAALFAPLAAGGPRRGAASLGLMLARRLGPADRAEIDAMLALADSAALPAGEQVALHFALGKALADLDDRAGAMRHYDIANALHRTTQPRFDRAGYAAFIDRLIATYTPARLAAPWGVQSRSARPVLVVGMIRSGTTLVEQLLATHPAVATAGELTYWPVAAAAGDRLPADEAEAASLIAGYEAALSGVSAGAARVIDKLPFNVHALGLVHLLFPHARFLHCRRAPADTGLSIYRVLFGNGHEYAYDQGDIAFVLRQYERLAAHWRAVLPRDAMLEVQYESLVAAPAATARAMLAFCGLDPDLAGADHTLHTRMIRTASAWQARQKVHTDAAGVARRFAPHLGELATLLEAPGAEER